ncbi:MAG: hypothetical protein GY801_25330 [bacterium]|nr:hypothetical protein [bacterium]
MHEKMKREKIRHVLTPELIQLAKLSEFRRSLLGCTVHIAGTISFGLFCISLYGVYKLYGITIALLMAGLSPLWALPIGLILSVIVAFYFEAWIKTPAEPFITELKRRFGLLDFEIYVNEEKLLPGIHATILVSGNGLPHGNHHWMRIRLYANGKSEIVSCVSKPDGCWCEGKPAEELVNQMTCLLSSDAERTLSQMLSKIDLESSQTIDSLVKDGFPCKMGILQENHAKHYQLICNLSGLPEDADTLPSVQLFQWLIELEQQVNPAQEVIGSCDPQGNITVKRN